MLILITAILSFSSLFAVSHTARQTRPIQLGTSGGSTVDKANGFCCSGTLGSLVKDANGKLYILSNTHVFAGDTVLGGNGKISKKGDPINQPGYVDVNCQNIPTDYVATLYDWLELVPNGIVAVDAAIAAVGTGKVDPTGKILEIGTISRVPKTAFLGQRVKKSGRTSGLTRGQVFALHASVMVQYEKECAGSAFVTTLKDQILVTPGTFLRAGDSGSLMCEDVLTNPRPVGLLFAGSSSIAVANPIQAVLNRFLVTMVGVTGDDEEELEEEPLITHAAQVKEDHADLLMQVKGAVGHAVGLSSEDGTTPVILLLVEKATKKIRAQAPVELDGVPVEVCEVGKIIAFG